MAEGRIAQYISHEFKTASNGGEYVAVKVNYEGKSVTWRGFQTAVASFRAALAEENPLTYGQWREWTVQLGKPRTTDSGQTYENTNLLSVGIVAKARRMYLLRLPLAGEVAVAGGNHAVRLRRKALSARLH